MYTLRNRGLYNNRISQLEYVEAGTTSPGVQKSGFQNNGIFILSTGVYGISNSNNFVEGWSPSLQTVTSFGGSLALSATTFTRAYAIEDSFLIPTVIFNTFASDIYSEGRVVYAKKIGNATQISFRVPAQTAYIPAFAFQNRDGSSVANVFIYTHGNVSFNTQAVPTTNLTFTNAVAGSSTMRVYKYKTNEGVIDLPQTNLSMSASIDYIAAVHVIEYSPYL